MAANILIKFATEKSYSNKKQVLPYQFQLRSLNDHFTRRPTCIYECILIRTH